MNIGIDYGRELQYGTSTPSGYDMRKIYSCNVEVREWQGHIIGETCRSSSKGWGSSDRHWIISVSKSSGA